MSQRWKSATGSLPRRAGVVAGFAGFWLLERGLHRAAQSQDARHSPRPTHPIVALNFIGNVLHNAVDGSIIAAAFLTTPTVGVVTTLAIVLHEIPRELGSFGVFMHGGLSVRRAVWYNGLTGIAAVASAALTLRIGARTAGAATTLLPVAAGTFLYIAVSVAPSAILDARRVLIGSDGWDSPPSRLAATAVAARFA